MARTKIQKVLTVLAVLVALSFSTFAMAAKNTNGTKRPDGGGQGVQLQMTY